MANPEVSIRELRNHGGDVVDRVVAGEHLILTRSGEPVAELRPLRRGALPAATLLQRWRNLPTVDALRLRDELDSAIDPSL